MIECVLELSVCKHLNLMVVTMYMHRHFFSIVNIYFVKCLIYLNLQLPIQSVPITTKVVSSNPVHGQVYWIQHYVIKFVSDLRQAGGFLQVLRCPAPMKLAATI